MSECVICKRPATTSFECDEAWCGGEDCNARHERVHAAIQEHLRSGDIGGGPALVAKIREIVGPARGQADAAGGAP